MNCMFDSKSWQCPLCQYKNSYDKNAFGGRYMTSIERSHCAECVSPNITMEYELPVVK